MLSFDKIRANRTCGNVMRTIQNASTLVLSMLLLCAALLAQSGRQKPVDQTPSNPCKGAKEPEAPKPLSVLFNVLVTDASGRPVSDVNKADFKIYEDGVPQELSFLNKREGPLNYGLVVDTSGSLRPEFEKVISTAAGLVSMNSPDDETFLIRFISWDKIDMVQDWTTDQALLRKGLGDLFIEGGQSAIIDAVYESANHLFQRLKTADAPRRAGLVLITDGEDRQSYYTERQLMKLLRNLNVQVFIIGFTEELEKKPSIKATNLLLKLAQESGGRALFPSNALADAIRIIHQELTAQYFIGYTPTNQTRDRSARKIRIEIGDKPGREGRLAVNQPSYVALCP
jgi:Ca-activated chloride channel family protein